MLVHNELPCRIHPPTVPEAASSHCDDDSRLVVVAGLADGSVASAAAAVAATVAAAVHRSMVVCLWSDKIVRWPKRWATSLVEGAWAHASVGSAW